MKIIFKSAYVALAAVGLFFLQSCDKTIDPLAKGAYQSGVLIVNEGNFSASTGDVTYYNSSTNLLEQTIFKKVNGAFAGKVLQSITVDGDNGYLVLNGDNKIEIVDINTFKRKNTFTNPKLINPRYLKVINGKAYISVWGSYDANFSLVDSYVMVVDVNTLKVVTSIDTDEGVENLVYDGKYLYVSKNGFSVSHSISVIDPSTDRLVKEVDITKEPRGMALDVNNKLWTITSDSLVQINPSTLMIERTIQLGSAAANSDLTISSDKKSLIYSVGKSIYKVSINATVPPTTPFFTVSNLVTFYGLGVDPKTSEVYIGDALDYASEGDVYIYNADGSFKKKIKAGIDPTNFVFR
jgi:hypothetical protein